MFERSGFKRIYLHVNIGLEKRKIKREREREREIERESVTNVSGEKVTTPLTTRAWLLVRMLWLTF